MGTVRGAYGRPNRVRRDISRGAVNCDRARRRGLALTDRPERRSAASLISGMGWEELPYDCVGLTRSRRVSDTRIVWSWMVLVPWAANDSKPWIDGVELIDNPLMKDANQKALVLGVMRKALDDRYGESVGSRAVDDLLKRLQDES